MEQEWENGEVVTLLDEAGKEIRFDLLMTFDYEGKRYAALLPIDPVENVGEDEVILLEIRENNGEQVYETIENPVLLDEVFEEFSSLFDEEIAKNDEPSDE